MVKMTLKQIEACYEVGKKFHAKEISMQDAIIELVDIHKMNSGNSAQMYIQFFRYCMNDKKYTQSISAAGLEYYLKNVLKDYGKKQLEIFLQGLEKHIKYRQEKMKLGSPGACNLYNKYSKEIGLSQRL